MFDRTMYEFDTTMICMSSRYDAVMRRTSTNTVWVCILQARAATWDLNRPCKRLLVYILWLYIRSWYKVQFFGCGVPGGISLIAEMIAVW